MYPSQEQGTSSLAQMTRHIWACIFPPQLIILKRVLGGVCLQCTVIFIIENDITTAAAAVSALMSTNYPIYLTIVVS